MDTLEQSHGIPNSERCPILWRGKSLEDLMRDRFGDCMVTSFVDAKRSLTIGAQYCRKLYVSRNRVIDGRSSRQLIATLIEIPDMEHKQ